MEPFSSNAHLLTMAGLARPDTIAGVFMTVKLVLRGKEYEVKAGMTLLDSLKKINVLSESVLAVRNGEMILDDEILKDGEVVKLVAVISGGAQ
jgi:sulfur carrier protein ThiS